jgi:hypothetical protein
MPKLIKSKPTDTAETTIRIVWDGEAAGLARHRLSLAEFSPALAALLRAMRRLASEIASDTELAGERAGRGGRLARLGKQIDLELIGVEEGSLGLLLACVLPLHEGPGVDEGRRLADQACSAFVTAVELESAGHERHDGVRAYLRALPAGVGAQSYEVRRSDGEVRTVRVGQMKLLGEPRARELALLAQTPSLAEVKGHIAGIDFESDSLIIRLMEEGSRRALPCRASSALVERAIAVRTQPVRALLVHEAGQRRLLRLHTAGEVQALSPGERDHLMWQRWDDLLRKLAT